MKKILLSLGLVLISLLGYSQSYVNDSDFSYYQKQGKNYVYIKPTIFNRRDTFYSIDITIEKFTDFGLQPINDSTFTGSGVVSYSIGATYNAELSINGNDYINYKKYDFKFLFWAISNYEKLIIR